MTVAEILVYILGGAAILTYVMKIIKGLFAIKKGVDDPNIKQDTKILLLSHDINGIKKDVHDMKTNHINHIERDIKELVQGQARIEGILSNK